MKQLFFGTVLFLFGSIAKTQVTAQDGKTYRTVKVGNQTWMAENLDVSTYRNGDSIPQVQDPKLWSSLKAGAWCYYESKNDMGVIYGKLYNWYAVIDPRGLAPEGWHIPSDAEWTQFAGFLGGRVGTSGKIKSPRGWSGGGNGTNETNFSALPGGTRSVELFSFAGNYGYWWTSSEFDSYSAWNRFLSYNNNDVGRSTGWKQFGNSVRCIKGEVENNFKPAPTEITASIPDSSKGTAAVVNPGFNPDAVSFGDQTWMKQNLDIATFKNGDRIPEVISDSAWIKAGQLKQPAWCYYNNDSTNKKLGKLYNWFAVIDKRGLAPEGWHVPNE
ncbi:MAG TPA: FISUMP domain-containing protein, partial [Chitinophagaceae bacterium]